jgi:hypothetical protein
MVQLSITTAVRVLGLSFMFRNCLSCMQ